MSILQDALDKVDKARGVSDRILLTKAESEALYQAAKESIELQETFDSMWDADMRAIKRWQAATGNDHIWPDRAKLVEWLLHRLDTVREGD